LNSCGQFCLKKIGKAENHIRVGKNQNNHTIPMKNTLLFFLSLIGFNSLAQDKIYLKNGEKIEAKIIKVTEEKIEYKKFNNQNGPLFEISVDKTQLVVYENGESQIFQETKSNKNNDLDNKSPTLLKIELI
jgi:hypothetical protein